MTSVVRSGKRPTRRRKAWWIQLREKRAFYMHTGLCPNCKTPITLHNCLYWRTELGDCECDSCR